MGRPVFESDALTVRETQPGGNPPALAVEADDRYLLDYREASELHDRLGEWLESR